MTTCFTSIRSRVARITKNDICCKPVGGPCSQIVTDGYVSIEYEMEVEEGDDVTVKKANGAICIADKSCDAIKWVNVTITFCQVDPDIFTMIAGYPAELDFLGSAVGNRLKRDVLCDGSFGLEAWSDIPGPCSVAGNKQYGYFLLPCVRNAILTGFTLENDAASFEVTARAEFNSQWLHGPHLVVASDDAVPPTAVQLPNPILADEALLMRITTVPPPVAVCGCTALTLPPVP